MKENQKINNLCHICGKKLNEITTSHLKTHGLTLKEYRLLFGSNNNSFIPCMSSKVTLANSKCILHGNLENQLCILHCSDRNKDLQKFQDTFSALLKLYEILDTDYHLEGIYFPSNIDFSGQMLHNSVLLVDCNFYGYVKVKNIFEGNVDFSNSIFFENADFSESEFLKEVKFGASKFLKRAIFRRVKFNDYSSFWSTEFNGYTSFRSSRFFSRVAFGDSKFPKYPEEVHFISIKFEKPKQTLFSGVDFSSTLFRFTELTEINFENVNWSITSKIKGARRYLLDEIFASNIKKGDQVRYSKKDYYIHAQYLYQQLKRNYEERRNYREAGDFYFGEMECYRKSNIFRRYLPSLVNLYRISSGYGQRYIRAGIVLILLFLFFSTMHMFIGLHPTENNTYCSTIHYSFEICFMNLDSFLSDLLNSSIYCVEVLTREEEQDRLFRPLRFGGEILNSTLSVIVYVQILFFILALRRHFKR